MGEESERKRKIELITLSHLLYHRKYVEAPEGDQEKSPNLSQVLLESEKFCYRELVESKAGSEWDRTLSSDEAHLIERERRQVSRKPGEREPLCGRES